MALLKKMLKGGKAVYWAPLRDDDGEIVRDAYAKPAYAEPVQLNARWELEDVLFSENAGQLDENKNKVYVSADVEKQGVLWQGVLADLTDTENPFNNTQAYEVKRFKKIPNIRQTKFLRIAFV